MIGRTLGHYEIIEPLGAGGMGEVYRAHDTTLKRDVAIKVLPEDLAEDVERLARLEREAQLLAALNHPNIEVIHGLEESVGVRFMVLELIEGESLAEKLSHGRIEVERALGIARQIAEALEAAHAKGIIHRDLKPGNVVITPEGQAKVLDFGLAKTSEGEGADPSMSPDITESPTVAAATQAGIILGTAAYMSPEQARGKPLDKRTDIWSFGCVLYEMLTGRRPFEGETVTDIIAAIVEREPDWTAVPGDGPPLIHLLLRRCLEKDPYQRLHDIADARIELVRTLSEPDGPEWMRAGPAVERRWPLTSWLPSAVAVFAVAALIGVTSGLLPGFGPEEPARSTRRFEVDLMPGAALPYSLDKLLAVSPDGLHLVYVAETQDGGGELIHHKLEDLTFGALPGTGRARRPFFSPDGRWVGFFAEARLKKVSLDDHMIVDICAADALHTYGTWGADGTIVFSKGAAGLWKVPDSGGEPVQLLEVEPDRGERLHRRPYLMPGGEAVLFEAWLTGHSDIRLLSLETLEARTLIERGTSPRPVPSGHLVFARGSSLLAVPFDFGRAEVTGTPTRVIEGIGVSYWVLGGTTEFDFSSEGTLVYMPARLGGEGTLVWVNRRGDEEVLIDGAFRHPELSPDRRRVAISVHEPSDWTQQDIWLLEIEHETLRRLTFEGENYFPTWSPDGASVIFTRRWENLSSIYRIASDFSQSQPQLVWGFENEVGAGFLSPDGRWIVYRDSRPATSLDIVAQPMGEGESRRDLIMGDYDERSPSVSPDGRWLAYVSDETGRNEVHVTTFPVPGSRWQVSRDGGTEPVWSPVGDELFYRNGREMIAVAFESEPEFRVVRSDTLFRGDYLTYVNWPQYDVDIDASRFLMVKPTAREVGPRLNVVLNWFEELKRLVPTEQ